MIGPRAHHNLFLPVGKDELTRNAPGAPTKSSSISILLPAVFCVPTLAPAQAPAPGLPNLYIDEDLQRATKLALELFVKGQEYG